MNCYTAQIIKRPTESSSSPINCTMLVGLTVRVRNKLTTQLKDDINRPNRLIKWN